MSRGVFLTSDAAKSQHDFCTNSKRCAAITVEALSGKRLIRLASGVFQFCVSCVIVAVSASRCTGGEETSYVKLLPGLELRLFNYGVGWLSTCV